MLLKYVIHKFQATRLKEIETDRMKHFKEYCLSGELFEKAHLDLYLKYIKKAVKDIHKK